MAYRKIEDSKLTAIADAIRFRLDDSLLMTIDEMPALIRSIGSNAVPGYWLKYLLQKETEINSTLDAAGVNKSAFLWYTDAHWTTNNGTSPLLLQHLSSNTGMSQTFFGGDIATAKSGEIEVMRTWQEQIKSIPNHHSVLGNHDDQVTELSSNADKSDFFFGHENVDEVVFGTSATDGNLYYYIDNAEEKTRYICLSTGRMWTSVDEVIWCINTLNSTPEGWHIVAISHLWLNMDYSGDSAVLITTPVDYSKVYLDLFDAYNHREKGNASLHGSAYDFRKGKAKVEFVIGGHIHQDYDFTTTRGIPVILTECDSWQERDDVSVVTKGTTTESCLYAIVADYDAKSVKVINIGRGDSRSLEIPDVYIEEIPEDVTYTNWVKKAYAGADMTVYNNGKGYKENVRVLSQSTDETEAIGWDTTGYIPIVKGSIIRFKNCIVYDLNGETSYNRMQFKFFDANFNYVVESDGYKPDNHPSAAWSAVHDDNGDLIQVTVPTSYSSSIRYVRITLHDITDESIITVDELIDNPDSGDEGGSTTPDTPTLNCTNVLPTAKDWSNTDNVYNGIGYKTDTRISVSGGGWEDKTESGWCASGLIPANTGDIIRLANCKFPKTNPVTTTHRCSIYGANADGTYSGYMVAMSDLTKSGSACNPVYDTDGDNVIQFTIPSSIRSGGYFRIVVQEFTVQSIVTVNEEIE